MVKSYEFQFGLAQFQINLAPGFGPRKQLSLQTLGAWHFSIRGYG
jgi:hypothetical protein